MLLLLLELRSRSLPRRRHQKSIIVCWSRWLRLTLHISSVILLRLRSSHCLTKTIWTLKSSVAAIQIWIIVVLRCLGLHKLVRVITIIIVVLGCLLLLHQMGLLLLLRLLLLYAKRSCYVASLRYLMLLLVRVVVRLLLLLLVVFWCLLVVVGRHLIRIHFKRFFLIQIYY